MSRALAISKLYDCYMREENISLMGLAKRLNAAWRARGQKPRTWHWPKALGSDA